jgi:TolB-like protein
MSFVEELKRRNVVRAGIAYVVIGWVLAQVAEFAFENFGAPEWVLKSFVILLLLGLPVVLIVAWAFEVTPDGIKREKDVDSSESITTQTRRRIDYLIVGVLVVAVAVLLFDKLTGDDAPGKVAADSESIAVLPFANMSDDSDHFADGLTEELLNLLAKNPDLKVAGRTSSFAFKGRNEDLRAIGDALNVEKVLEGSVRRSGNRVRVTAQLINVEDGFHIWSDTYDRDLADIFEIQDEVAGAITRALKLHLTPAAERLTNNPEAYALYLEAVALASFQNSADIPKGIAILDRATALDPQFAKAFELKAFFHWMNAGWYVTAETGRANVHEAATRALAIDPTLAGAISLAKTSDPNEWSWVVEMEALEMLVESDRGVRALDTYGYDLNASGYFSEAETIHREILARDPLSANAWWRLAESLFAQGRDDEAIQAAQKSAELDPGYLGPGIGVQVNHALSVGDDDRAIRLLSPVFDEEYFQRPSAEAFVRDMRDPDTGREALQEWVDYRIANSEIANDVGLAQMNYLMFGYLDLYEEAIDAHAAAGTPWSDGDTLESFGVFFPAAGYRKSQHYLERAEANGLFDLWDSRGAPDHCSKETREWVCQ